MPPPTEQASPRRSAQTALTLLSQLLEVAAVQTGMFDYVSYCSYGYFRLIRHDHRYGSHSTEFIHTASLHHNVAA